MYDRTGQQLGNYRLLHLLGQGGFANVYLGEHTHLNTRAAVKVLHEQMEAQALENFLKEAQTIATLKHPHILRVLDFGMDDSTPFLVMEYAPGGTLRKKHPHGSIVSLSTIVPYVKQVTAALQYAHDQQLVHRDVKPENMLVEAQGSIVLGDFGIAIPVYDTQTFSTQEVGGTPYYMAPEQCRGKAREASDQYALGVVVYEWLCGVLPFYGASAIEIAMHHLMDLPPSLQERIAGIPVEVEQVVLRALAKDPQERFSNVQEFAQALEQASQPKKSAIAVLPLSVLLSSNSNSNSNTQQSTILQGPVIPMQSTISTMPLAQIAAASFPAGTLLSTYHGHSATISGIGQSSNGALIASGEKKETALVWNAPIEKQVLTPRGYSKYVSMVAWSPDGTRIASGGWDKVVQVWKARTGEQISTCNGHSRFVFAVTWSPDSTHIASGSTDRTVQIWDAKTGEQIRTYSGHKGFVFTVAWSPDGTRIASGGGDKTVQVWDAATGEQTSSYSGHSDGVSRVAWSPDGTRIASGSHDKTVQVWDATTGQCVYTYSRHAHVVLAIAWSPDGTRIASGGPDGTVQVWDVTTGERVCTYSRHSQVVYVIAWSPDGTRIASGSGDKTVQIWEATTGKHVLTYSGHSDSVNAVAWSPDGVQVASGSKDGTVQVWQA
ncbi:MAG TPA: serine/threonine-protein kinase [Ktedonobacteraceae bacterium]